MNLDDVDFWYRYLRLTDTPELSLGREDKGTIDILSGEGLGIRIVCDVESIDAALLHPSLREPVQIGWDDDAHWHPHCLRFPEAVSISSACRNLPSEQALLLLLPFCAASPDEDISQISGSIKASLQKCLRVDESVAENLTKQIIEASIVDGRWKLFGDRWVLEEINKGKIQDAYSLRNLHNSDFPWEELDDLLKTTHD